MKFPLYLYSTKNLVGSGLAIGAFGLYILGIVQDFWWIIAAGAYGAGALGAPGNSKMDVEMQKQMNDNEIIQGLTSIAKQANSLLPEQTAIKVIQICINLSNLLPAITQSGLSDQIRYDVRMAATEYLPKTINAYLRLPKTFRVIARSNEGKTADVMLDEQITTLNDKIQEILKSVALSDVSALSENGRFLRERFSGANFTKTL